MAFPSHRPVLSFSENLSNKFSANPQNKNESNGAITIEKIIHTLPMTNAWGSTDNNLSLEILFSATFDNGKDIKYIELSDFRDDLGNTYPITSSASPFSGSYSDKTDVGQVWTQIYVDPKKIAGAKKISFTVSSLSEDANNTYSFFGSNVTKAHPQGFTITNILLH